MAKNTQGQTPDLDSSKDIDRYPYDTPYCHRTFLSSLSPALNNLLLIKRSPVPDEYPLHTSHKQWELRRYKEALRNEAAAIDFVRQYTTIPVPNVVAAFEDRGAFYIMMEKVQGAVCLMDIPLDKRGPVYKEMEGFCAQLNSLQSEVFGGVKGDTFLPLRIAKHSPIGWSYLGYRPKPDINYVFCHGDLHFGNILVDPITLKVKCIIDWECAGFYPEEFERRWYLRDGPSGAIGQELDDSKELMNKLYTLADPLYVKRAREAEALDWDGVWEAEEAERRQSIPNLPTRRLTDARIPPRLHLVQDLDFAIVDVYRLLSHVIRGTRTPFSQFKGSVAAPVLTTTSPASQVPQDVLAKERTLEVRRGDQEAIKLMFRLVDLVMAARKAFPSIRFLMDKSLKREADALASSRSQVGPLPASGPGPPPATAPPLQTTAVPVDLQAQSPVSEVQVTAGQAVAQKVN